MTEGLDLRGERVTGASSSEARSGRRSSSRSAGWLQAARFLLTWLAAFVIIIALFSVFGEQLKGMSLPLRALIVSGALVIAMNFLVMPGLARLLARFGDPGGRSGPDPAT